MAPRPQHEAEYNLRKAKQGYTQRCDDHDKARALVAKAEEEQASAGPGAGGAASKTLDKRRRLEEEAKNKVGAGSGGRGAAEGARPSGGRSRGAMRNSPAPRAVHPARSAFPCVSAGWVSVLGLTMP